MWYKNTLGNVQRFRESALSLTYQFDFKVESGKQCFCLVKVFGSITIKSTLEDFFILGMCFTSIVWNQNVSVQAHHSSLRKYDLLSPAKG